MSKVTATDLYNLRLALFFDINEYIKLTIYGAKTKEDVSKFNHLPSKIEESRKNLFQAIDDFQTGQIEKAIQKEKKKTTVKRDRSEVITKYKNERKYTWRRTKDIPDDLKNPIF